MAKPVLGVDEGDVVHEEDTGSRMEARSSAAVTGDDFR